MAYIVVNYPSINPKFDWGVEHSMDGVLYEDFGRALQQCKILNGVGVVEVSDVKDVKNEEAGND